MTLLKCYLSHYTNRLIRKIRYKEAWVHVTLARQHRRHLLSKQQIVDVYPQIIVDVPKISLNRIQLDYLSKSDLYTMLPQEESLDILIEFLLQYDYQKVQNIPIDIIRKLAIIVIKENVFVYEKKFYRQVIGGAMGSAFTLTLANIFMWKWEKQLVHRLKLSNEIYGRYVDDIFFTSNDSLESIDQMLDEANNFHPNIKLVRQIGRSVPFLDVLIENRKGTLTISVYHKEAAEPYVVPFGSDHPGHVFRNTADTAITRAVRYSTTLSQFEEEIRQMNLIFLYNVYTSRHIDWRLSTLFSKYLYKYFILPMLNNPDDFDYLRHQLLTTSTATTYDKRKSRMFRVMLLLLIVCSNLPSTTAFTPTPMWMRGLWCVAQYTESSQTYTQIGQAFFYNNGTITHNFLDNLAFTQVTHFLTIDNTDETDGIYQVYTNTTQGPPEYVNKASCFWYRQMSNGDVASGRQSNGTCTRTFELDTTSTAIRYTRNPSTCHFIDDEDTNLVLSDTSFEKNQILALDRQLPLAKRRGIVFYGSSSIRLWSNLSSDFPYYTVLNRGFGGSALTQCLREWKRIVYPLEPSVIILYAGENDIAAGNSPSNIQSAFRRLIPAIRRFYPNIPIGYISVKPSPYRIDKISKLNETNIRIQGDIKLLFPDVTFINIWPQMLTTDGQPRRELFGSDTLHMNAKGYAIWAKAVNNYLSTV
ncbi:unnamed protein product [Rotaria socialis]